MRWTGEVYKNTASKPQEVIKQNARVVNVITVTDNLMKDPYEIAMVVSKARPFEEYKEVVRHTNRAAKREFTGYSKSLLDACFRGWH